MEFQYTDTQISDEMKRQAKRLAPVQLARDASTSLNRAGTAARTYLSKSVRETLRVRASDLKEALGMRRATPGNLVVTFDVDYRPLPIDSFRARQTQAGVTVRMKPGGGTRIPGAFLISAYGNRAYRRAGAGRGPLERLYGPSVGSQVRKHWEGAERRGLEVFARRMENQIERRFDGTIG